MTITATLYGPDGRPATVSIDARPTPAPTPGRAGRSIRSRCRHPSPPGAIGIVVESALGRTTVARRNHLLGPGAVGVSRRDDVPFTAMAVTALCEPGPAPP